MSQTVQCNCNCGNLGMISLPIRACMCCSETKDTPTTPTGIVPRTWESDWFTVAASGAYSFNHDLNLSSPWLCQPRLVAEVVQADVGWEVGDIIFADGANYVGATADFEIGWAICVAGNTIKVSLGNSTLYATNAKKGGMASLKKTSVRCKLVMSY